MIQALLFLLAGSPFPPPSGAPSEPQSTPSGRFQIQASRVDLGDGNRIDDGVVVVEGGRIVRAGPGTELDERQPVLRYDGVLTAGMVVCQTHSGAAGEVYDSTRSLLPEARLAYAFDPDHSDFEKALRAGITSMVVAPSAQNVAGGITAVVKSHGGRVLKKEAHLALSFTGAALEGGQGGPFSFFGAFDHLDGGPETTVGTRRGSRYPTSYPGTLAALSERLARPEGAFARAARGELAVLIEAWDRHEVVRALTFAQAHGLTGALRGAPLAAELVPLFKESGFGAILGPYGLGQARRSLESFVRLSEAGVPVAFALDAPAFDPDHLRLSAAMTLTAGADPVRVWKALTSDAARLAGVADRVGVLERGKDADLVLWSGDPLNLTSRVLAVFVDGELAYDGGRSE